MAWRSWGRIGLMSWIFSIISTRSFSAKHASTYNNKKNHIIAYYIVSYHILSYLIIEGSIICERERTHTYVYDSSSYNYYYYYEYDY